MYRLSRRNRIAAGLLAATLELGFLMGPLVPGHAAAQFTGCRSDPVVTLSNGALIDLQASISDSTSDVKKIAYVVHVPSSTKVVSVVNTDGLIGLTETVQVYADNSANTYDSSTTVSTGQKNVAVTATTTAVSALGVTLGLKSASGVSGQNLLIHFTSLL